MKRELVGDPFADRILALRTDLTDAGIEWALASREAASAQARFESLCPKPSSTPIDVDPDLQHASAMFIETIKREHDAMVRWKATARAIVEALERTAPPERTALPYQPIVPCPTT